VKNKKFDINMSHIVIAFLLVFAVGAVAGCVGNDVPESPTEDTDVPGEEVDEETEVTSVDITFNKYEDELVESVNIKARNFDEDTPDLRVEIEDERTLIFNNEEGVGYDYDPETGVWTQLAGTMAEAAVVVFAQAAVDGQNVAMDYGVDGTADFAYGGEAGEIIVNEVNPTISDDEFTPPDGAEIEETPL